MAIVLSENGEQVVYKTMKKEEGVTCDICEKFIKADGDYRTINNRKYFKVTTGHHDWGNDSCESIEKQDVCPECIGKFVTEYLQNSSRTAYIDIETRITYPGYHWVDTDD